MIKTRGKRKLTSNSTDAIRLKWRNWNYRWDEEQKSFLAVNHFGEPRGRNYLCVIRIELITPAIGVAQRN